jgi:hypothetical protein
MPISTDWSLHHNQSNQKKERKKKKMQPYQLKAGGNQIAILIRLKPATANSQ